MNTHIRIGDSRNFALKQAVLLYQDGTGPSRPYTK